MTSTLQEKCQNQVNEARTVTSTSGKLKCGEVKSLWFGHFLCQPRFSVLKCEGWSFHCQQEIRFLPLCWTIWTIWWSSSTEFWFPGRIGDISRCYIHCWPDIAFVILYCELRTWIKLYSVTIIWLKASQLVVFEEKDSDGQTRFSLEIV